MIRIVFIMTILYFLIGALAIYRMGNKSDPTGTRQPWVKYLVYLFIVTSMILVIYFTDWFRFLAFGMVSICLYELAQVAGKSKVKSSRFFYTSLVTFLLMAALFFQFSLYCPPAELLLVYVMVFTFDGFSQIFGQLFGKHLLFPAISPSKTWEGLIGGLLLSFATMYLLSHSSGKPLSFPKSLLLVLAAFAGDVFSSAYKRVYGVKDYSRLIPGHGGMLDRFNSFLSAGSVYYVVQ
mgnify:CR=1 FL=1